MIIAIDIIKFIVLVLITFLTCQIITNNKKRISYIGTILICFSTAIIEYINSGLPEAIIFGEIVFVCFDKLIDKAKYQYLWSICISLRIIWLP